ncbi:hypothetical protein EMCRGX_G002009 [Ephydatia muelleri]
MLSDADSNTVRAIASHIKPFISESGSDSAKTSVELEREVIDVVKQNCSCEWEQLNSSHLLRLWRTGTSEFHYEAKEDDEAFDEILPDLKLKAGEFALSKDTTVALWIEWSTAARSAAAQAGEVRKHSANDDKCGDLGWFCIPLVTETYGAWGAEAKACFSQLASRLSIRLQKSKSVILYELYGRLNTCLVRCVATAILSRIQSS